jgi:dienelactone hydrolase
MIKYHKYCYQGFICASLILLSMTISSCSKNVNTIAYNISKQAGFKPAEIKGGEFVLRVYYRFDKPGAPLHVYLEGDGRSWLTPSRASYNPTPRDPIGLSLAAQDYADNVLYIARPCQYVPFDKNPNCEYPYWTHKRFAPEIIKSVSAVIDRGKKMAKARGVELIGFSGGGAVAILVASKRRDVTGIRTVAGNLDHEEWTNHHKIDPMKGSLNPVDVAKKVSRIPQIHYVGMLDKVIERTVADSFKQRAGGSRANCVQIKEIIRASHTKGWEKLWVRLNKIKLPDCT